MDWVGHFSLICIPLFGLLSGYLLVYHEIRYRKLLSLWGMVFFYSIMGEIAAVSLGYQKNIYWGYALFPVLRCRWWYVTAYFVLYPFMGFLNSVLKKSGLKHCLLYLFLMLLILVTNPFSSAIRTVTGGGFSVFNLMGLYVIGACIRRIYDSDMTAAKCRIAKLRGARFFCLIQKTGYDRLLTLCMAALVICYLAVLLIPYAAPQIPPRFYDFLVGDFYAPLNIGAALLFFLFFCKKRFASFQTVLKIFAIVALDVYIIHMHPCLKHLVFESYHRIDVGHSSVSVFLLEFCIRVLAIIGVCAGIAWLRKYICRILHLEEHCNWMLEKIGFYVRKMFLIQNEKDELI